MRLPLLLAVFYLATAGSDLARVYPPGSEPAKGGQDLARVFGNGKELAQAGNSNLGRDWHDDRTR